MPMRRRSPRPPEEDFPMTPMIDMVFLLLVFFMTVSTLAQADRRVELDLAESAESRVPDDLADRGVISIDARGRLYQGAVERDLETVKALITKALSENPALRVQVRADRETPYGVIRKVLRGCAEAGASEILYATHEDR